MSLIHVNEMCVSLLLLATHVVMAQPSYRPDPTPKAISTEEFNKAIGGPTLVTMDFKDARPEQVYEALAQQVGMLLYTDESISLLKALPPMTVSIKNQPFLATL